MKEKQIKLFVKTFGFCSCADDEIFEDIGKVLKETSTKKFYITEICKKLKLKYKYVHLILCVLDTKRFLQHGCAIRGSWITNKGIEFLKEVNKNGK